MGLSDGQGRGVRNGLAVMVSLVFAGLFGMMRGVVEVPFGDVHVVARLFMITQPHGVRRRRDDVWRRVRGAPLPGGGGLLLLQTRVSLL